MRGVPKEVLACLRVLGEVFGKRAVSLEYVARPTRRHYVARRAVSTAQARLHVIQRQCRRRLHIVRKRSHGPVSRSVGPGSGRPLTRRTRAGRLRTL